MSNIYETESLTQIDNGSMHPGGLRLTDRAVRLAALEKGMRVADIGCGTGATAAFLTDRYKLNIIGLDISDTLLDIGLNSHPGLNLIRGDGHSLPFEGDSLDAIFFECTLSVLGDARHTLAQAAKVLKPSGVVVISDVYIRQQTNARIAHPVLLTSDELMETLEAAGFDVIVSEDHTPALRTFAAELRAKSGTEPDIKAGCLFGVSCDLSGVRLSELGYMLIIAKRTGD